MHRRVALLLTILLAGCASLPGVQHFEGGTAFRQPGVSLVLPASHDWSAITRSTYQAALAALATPKNDTLIVAVNVYNLPPATSKEAFLEVIRTARANEPKTGRFELIRNAEKLYDAREETCVIYRATSKDFGVEGRRGGKYSVLETLGMHCVHPSRPQVGVHVELSRKAPPGTRDADFEAEGLALLQSVTFGAF